ncbi:MULTISPECIES: PHP domain-containing protein [unclassified Sedimentibacter]|uniref:PHP domain-containing protein n=1 Tax=unclassified Sedimentibacter TaxID=2649220 RepID=UPI0027DEF59B|nr:PHP domain-containing protein [Sedimentibacter sp. MB35-C1]WMJ77171.1 PHP domain-containing protein [Sedimentibacter sp. MB35-C1]
MRTIADYHVHSTYSRRNHGKSTIEEIVQRAVEIGLEEIAVTDHGPSHYFYGIKMEKIKESKEKIIQMRKKYPQIKILMGVEANILDYKGNTDISDEVLKYCDIILCGYHIGTVFSSLDDVWKFTIMNKIGRKSKKVFENMREKNTEAVINAMNKYKINILTHPGDKIPLNTELIAKTAEKTGTILEINNSHSHLNAEEIKIASKYDVKFVINSDAHIKDNIGRYENGLKEAMDAKLDLSRIINLR